MRSLRYAFDEALASLGRGWHSGILSTATIALALFVLGAFLLVTANLARLGGEWSGAAELSVYLKDEATDVERRAVEMALAPGGAVASHEFVSKSEALVRFKRTFGDLATAIDSLGDNPLPASFEVRLRPGASTGDALDTLGRRLRQMAGVVDVRFDRQWLDRLLSAVAIVRQIGLALGLVLALAAGLTVANVVRLALYARRDELEIMQLVGAPQAYVRGPFVMEGLLQRGLGALLALVALGGVFLALRARYLIPLASAVNLTSVHFLPAAVCVLIVIGGMFVGCLGGLVAAWKN